MPGSIENLNKQIASFIIVSAALFAPVNANNAEGNDLIADASLNMSQDFGQAQLIVRYASPNFPIDHIKPVPAPIISMYAAPQPPIIREEILPIHVQPIVKYAAPQLPIERIEKIDIQNAAPALNESSLNINNTNNINIINNVNTPKLPNDMKATNVKADINVKNASNVTINDFVITDFGNVRIIEPFSHIIFK